MSPLTRRSAGPRRAGGLGCPLEGRAAGSAERELSPIFADVGSFTAGQFDWVFLDTAVELDDKQRSVVDTIARLAVIVVDRDEWKISDVAKRSVNRAHASSDATRSAS